jgi:hypothetical protein
MSIQSLSSVKYFALSTNELAAMIRGKLSPRRNSILTPPLRRKQLNEVSKGDERPLCDILLGGGVKFPPAKQLHQTSAIFPAAMTPHSADGIRRLCPPPHNLVSWREYRRKKAGFKVL